MKMNTMKNSSTSSDLLKHVKYQHLVAGVSGGVASSLILHPLDLIKIRFAVNDGRTAAVPRYNGLSSAFMTIVKQEGFRGLYRGVTPNVWGSGSAWGLYFLFYNTSKGWLQSGNTSVALAPYVHYLAATQAGMLSLLMTNPLWVVKTRLCLQNDSEHLGDKKYKGMVDGLTKIYKNEGIRGLYKGFVPGMFGVTHGALQFMAYEEMKNSYNLYRNLPIDCKLTTLEYIFFAATSKLVAAGATYPYQVVRARIQDHHRSYNGVWHCITETWRYEGWRGFYKGLKPSLVRVVPATVITFLTYENVSHLMLRRGRDIALPA